MRRPKKLEALLKKRIRRLESELKLLREADPEIIDRAVSAFDGPEGAVAWLTEPQRFCRDQTPLRWARTPRGRKEVMAQLARIDFGVYA